MQKRISGIIRIMLFFVLRMTMNIKESKGGIARG